MNYELDTFDPNGEKPEGMSWTEWRRLVRESKIDPYERELREEKREKNRQLKDQYRSETGAWADFKRRFSNTTPDKTTTGTCCCCLGIGGCAVVIALLLITFSLIAWYIHHAGIFLL
jgi:hypothetical protein